MAAANINALDLNIDFNKKYLQAQAERNFTKRKYKDAEAFYAKLAGAVEAQEEKLHAEAMAVLSYGRVKGRYDEALKRAEAIKNPSYSKYASADIMSFNNKPKGVVELLKDEKLSEWPGNIKYKGYLLRAAAYEKNGSSAEALSDYENCIKNADADIQVKFNTVFAAAKLYIKSICVVW
ncbi:MAG: hypothetical protein ACYTFY_23545 [Planctomycetota bacterium]